MKIPLKNTIIGLFIFFILFFFAFLFNQNTMAANIAATTSIVLLIGLMLLAGILDGFNPCAFSTLLLWTGFLLNRFGSEIDNGVDIRRQRKNILSYAFFYAFGIFFIYILLGLGILELFQLSSIQTKILAQVSGFVVVILGVLMVRDSIFKQSKAIIKMPAFLHPIYKRFSRPTSKLASFFSGIVIGLCSVPCGGAIYMAILIIIQSKQFLVKYPLLFVYNLGFILPVVIFAFILSNKKLLQRISQDFILMRSKLRLMIGIITILMGLFAIFIS
ncbi:cytochrome c biogenesis CcdA family protein [Niallia oryzisoli]|uniref:cytochrome c biogenesis CcdA family protein n=1 Tax=Niallia oryzisoli TaxID=1737571 RepID=UPI003737089B